MLYYMEEISWSPCKRYSRNLCSGVLFKHPCPKKSLAMRLLVIDTKRMMSILSSITWIHVISKTNIIENRSKLIVETAASLRILNCSHPKFVSVVLNLISEIPLNSQNVVYVRQNPERRWLLFLFFNSLFKKVVSVRKMF